MSAVSGRYLAAVFLLSGTLLVSTLASDTQPELLKTPLSATVPLQIGAWHALSNETLPANETNVLKPTAYLLRPYRRGNDYIELLIVFYAKQAIGENMHSPKNCLPASWDIRSAGFDPVSLPDGRRQSVNVLSLQKDDQKQLILYWFQSRRRVVASEYMAKLFLAQDALFRHRASGSLVRLALPDRPGALEDGLRFAADAMPVIAHSLE